MDAQLSQDAYRSLQALGLISSSSISDGLLIGHKRGHRFFVEKIFTTQKGFFPSLKKFHGLNQLFNEKLIGFFSFNTNDRKTKKILAPFAYGKLFLQIEMNEQKKMRIKSYAVEYEKTFYLFPIRLKHPKRRP